MMNRNKSQKSGGNDIRSRIKHENTRLGAGTEMGGKPNHFGLNTNAFQPSQQQQQQQQHQQQHQHQHQQQPASSAFQAPQPQYEALGVNSTGSRDANLHSQAFGQHQMSSQASHLQHQHRHLGAGPSFVSLSPSDSVSNFEGRAGNYANPIQTSGNGIGDPFDPSASSTASFAQGLGESTSHPSMMAPSTAGSNAPTPHRPARSIRRPNRMSAMSGVGPSPLREAVEDRRGATADSALNGNSDGAGISRGADRHAQSARLMAKVNRMNADGRETPASGQSEDEDGLLDIPGPGFDLNTSPSSPPLGSLTQQDRPAALGSVLSALSQAGRKQGQARILRGTTAEEESRRRQIERKVEAARTRESRPLEAYVDRADDKAFREIGAVLRKAKAEWDFVVDDDFNSVSLAFSLLDDSSLGANRGDFEEMKAMIEHALQGTVDDHYESFATAISLHNNVLNSLSSAQNGVSGARRRLRDAREALGAKRADLVQLWHRSQAVKESLRLLDTIDNLKGVPDRLESLMAEKQFFDAVNLLIRASKTCERAEISEVGATSDLRAYLKGQEQAMFDILLEELHNHLYLKSYFCDARWKAYTPGQTALPNVEFGREYDETPESGTLGKASGASNADSKMEGIDRRNENGADSASTLRTEAEVGQLKLFRYLKSLDLRPGPDLNDGAGSSAELLEPSIKGKLDQRGGTFMSRSGSASDTLGVVASKEDEAEFQQQNPETDSFLYIEMLLESLARLGKLKLTQEVILQRLPTELHQLVDATIDEVDARSEMMRRSSVAVVRPESLLLANSAALARSFAENARNSFRSSAFMGGSIGHLSMGGTSAMRLSTLESNQVERDCETMRDLFWTMFSKLDAVLQGHRVVFEVVSRIASRGASSAYKAVKVGKPSSLTDIWRPIQTEVRSLLHEHLVDESEGTSARRNAIVSINEVLRQGSFQRDRSKSLFRLVADATPKAGVNLSRKDFAPLRRHEEALTSALRASVPGLVGAMDASSNNAAIFQQQHQQHASHTRIGFVDGAGHKLLVKPDAFNISVLFQPALAFIERVKVLLPPEAAGRGEVADSNSVASSGFSRFLDEFVHDVFLNQLEDKVASLFATAVGGSDAFQEDSLHKSRTLGRPIVRSVANVIVLIDSLYAMLRTTPFHRQSYSVLITQTIIQYYQRCHERFRDLVSYDASPPSLSHSHLGSNAGPQSSRDAPLTTETSLSAMWAQRPELASCLTELVSGSCSGERARELMDLENALELNLSRTLGKTTARRQDSSASAAGNSAGGKLTGTIALRDLTTSRKKLIALGHLQHSLYWFYEHICKLKATAAEEASDDVAGAPVARLSLIAAKSHALQPINSSGTADSEKEEEEASEELRLPMNAAMVQRFKALPNTYKHLAHLVLFTLRLEVRARTIHHLDLAINEGNYLVEDAVLEPDPHVVDLNAELASLDDIFADTVLPEYHRFLFGGLASLMDLQICRAIRKVRFINRHGLTKMIRNILALQQNLRNIVVVNETMDGLGERAKRTESKSAASAATRSPSYTDEGFERSRKLWELVGKEPDELLASIRTTGAQHPFDDYHAALNLMLGLENGSTGGGQTGAPNSAIEAAGQGPLPPNANLRPGTFDQPREVSRQKLNEYLIELHEVAGEAI